MKNKTALISAIDHLGGVGRLAAAVGVRPSAVSNWLARNAMPSAIFCAAIERATKGAVTRRDLRPDDWHLIWPELVAACSQQSNNDAATGLVQPSPSTSQEMSHG